MTGAVAARRWLEGAAYLDRSVRAAYNESNKTRQGYARKRILKPAGYFFSGPTS